MSVSLEKQILTAIQKQERIPESVIAYLEQRALNEFHDYVLTLFKEERNRSSLTKAKLARRIGRGPEQINRLLANPSNWTIATVARLLAGIAAHEAKLTSDPICGRVPQNSHMGALLDEVEEFTPRTLTTATTETNKESAVVKYQFSEVAK